MNNPDLSIIILNYNTKKITLEAIASIEENYPEEVKKGLYEVLVADNASPDNSVGAFRKYEEKTKIKNFFVVDNKKNIGFAAGNNAAIPKSSGRYVLFLNPDTIVYPKTLQRMVEFMDNHPEAGAATCRVVIPSGGIDEASHRGFPTPWNSFCHFSGLEKLFAHSRLFDGYRQGWKDLNSIHEVDAIVGAFMMVPRKVGEELGWLDTDYFFYGEDLDFCFRVKKKGYKIYYVPDVKILHYGGVSSGIKKRSQNITTANINTKINAQKWRFDAMRIFYKKHYESKYPKIVTWLVLNGINFLHKKNTPKLKD